MYVDHCIKILVRISSLHSQTELLLFDNFVTFVLKKSLFKTGSLVPSFFKTGITM